MPTASFFTEGITITHSDLSSTVLGMLSGIFRISIRTSPAWRRRSASCCWACAPIESKSAANATVRIFFIVVPSSIFRNASPIRNCIRATRSDLQAAIIHDHINCNTSGGLSMHVPARFITVLLFFILISATSPARVVRVKIMSRTDVQEGKPFGNAGPYEKIVGRVYFAVDPANLHNRQIVDLDKAPRNANGEVEFSADLYLLRPKDTNKGNHAVLFEVSNRGGRGILSIVNGRESEYGDGFLMREGYTIAWVGWEFDLSS